jgi:hypothetical protein
MHKKLLLPLLLALGHAALWAQSGPCLVRVAPTNYDNGVTTLSALDSAATPVSTYAWSTGASTPTINVTEPGIYCVTATFADGCVAFWCDTLSNQQCWAYTYIWPGGGDTVHLQAISGPAYLDASYLWSTGATTQQASVTQPGEYCVTVTAENGCTATSCVTSAGSCTLGLSQFSDSSGVSLYANFGPFDTGNFYSWSTGASGPFATSIPITQPGEYCVTATNQLGCQKIACINITCSVGIAQNGTTLSAQNVFGTPPFAYAWSNGGNTQSIVGSPNAVYCVTITDAVGCSASTCDTLSNSGCGGYIEPQADGTLTGVSLGGISPFSYAWSTGATTANISPQPGAFNCVTITDALGCVATSCFYVYGPQEHFMNVWVQSPDSLSGVQAEVFLIQYDDVPGTLSAVQTAQTTNSFVQFSNIPNGEYLVKAALLPSDPNYAVYLPTYYNQKLLWSDAQHIAFNGFNGGASIVLRLVGGDNPGGPGFIGGLVSQGANLQAGPLPESDGPGDPFPGASIVLTLADGTPVATTTSGANGQFSFPNLAFGTYVLTIDVPGLAPVSTTITIGPAQPSNTATVFAVNSGDVVLSAPEAAPLLQGVSPNPFSDKLLVNLREAEGLLLLRNAQGQLLRRWQVNGTQMALPTQDLPPGAYFLSLQTARRVETTCVVRR